MIDDQDVRADWQNGLLRGVARHPARMTVEVMCCPRCRSTSVGRRDWDRVRTLAYWRCKDCGLYWREHREVGDGMVRAIIP